MLKITKTHTEKSLERFASSFAVIEDSPMAAGPRIPMKSATKKETQNPVNTITNLCFVRPYNRIWTGLNILKKINYFNLEYSIKKLQHV